MSNVKKHFNKIAGDYDYYKRKNKFYYENLKKLIKSLVASDKTVLEYGCGTGDILASLKLKQGIGYDLSSEMIKIAKNKYHKKYLSFTDNIDSVNFKFDYVLMCDVIEHLEHPLNDFKNISKLLKKNGNFICTMANPFWEPVLILAEKLGLKMPEGKHNRRSYEEIESILNKYALKVVKHDYFLLMPVEIPILTKFANNCLERYIKRYAFIEYIVAEKK